MTISAKKTIIGFSVLIVIVLISGLIANVIIKDKIENAINQNISENVTIYYNDFSVNVFSGKVTWTDLNVKAEKSNIIVSYVEIDDIKWVKYLWSNEIKIGKINISKPNIDYVKNTSFLKKKETDDTINQQFKTIKIENFELKDGKISIFDTTKTTKAQFLNGFNLAFEELKVLNPKKNILPIEYSEIELKLDTLFTSAGKYENLTGNEIYIDEDSISIDKINFKTKYDKTEYDKLLEVERDHFLVSAEDLNFQNWKYSVKNDTIYFKVSALDVGNNELIIYRNKLVNDNPKKKPLFNEVLRKLPFKFGVDSTNIENSNITYQEKRQEQYSPGDLIFNDLNIDISHLGNTYNKPTSIDAQGMFMNSADVNINWKLWINNQNAKFYVQAKLNELSAKELNKFVVPNLLISLDGVLKKTHFNIEGNEYSSKVNLALKYKDIKVNQIKKKDMSTKVLISSLANLFISKNSDNKSKAFDEAQAIVEPDRTKSFFNYIWVNLRTALKKILI